MCCTPMSSEATAAPTEAGQQMSESAASRDARSASVSGFLQMLNPLISGLWLSRQPTQQVECYHVDIRERERQL